MANEAEVELVLIEQMILQRRAIIPDGHSIFRDIYDLAEILYQRGAFHREAILRRELLEERNRVEGHEHPLTLAAKIDLAVSLVGTGQLDEACQLFREVAEARSVTVGNSHDDTLEAMRFLADTLRMTGQFDEEGDVRVKIARLEEIAGVTPSHGSEWASWLGPSATQWASRPEPTLPLPSDPISEPLELALQRLNDLQAELLDWRRAHFGQTAYRTIRTMRDLAWTQFLQGRFMEAQTLREFLLTDSINKYGADSPYTADAQEQLAMVLDGSRDYEASSRAWREAVQIRKGSLGPSNDLTQGAMWGFINANRQTGDPSESVSVAQELLEVRRATVGPLDEATLAAMDALIWAYAANSDHETAAYLGFELVRLRRQVLGPTDDATLWSQSRLALDLKAAGNVSEALAVEQETLLTRIQHFGEEHPATIESRTNVAVTLGMDDPVRAVEVQKVNVALAERALGSNDEPTLRAKSVLAALLVDVGQVDAGVELATQVLEAARTDHLQGSREPARVAEAILRIIDGEQDADSVGGPSELG